ncbi:hypothetical protein A3Q56_01117, partial [Intoshia linei]
DDLVKRIKSKLENDFKNVSFRADDHIEKRIKSKRDNDFQNVERISPMLTGLKIKYDFVEELLEEVGINVNIQMHNRYNDNVIYDFLERLSKKLNTPIATLLYESGAYFVKYLFENGYRKYILSIGRNYIELLDNIDNIHTYLKYTYTSLCPPIFVLKKIDENSYNLHYSSSRKYFCHYAHGILYYIAKLVYNTEVDVDIIENIVSNKEISVNFLIKIAIEQNDQEKIIKNTKLCSLTQYLATFNFYIIFDKYLNITHTSQSFDYINSSLINSFFQEYIYLEHPKIRIINLTKLLHYPNIMSIVVSMTDNDDSTTTSLTTTKYEIKMAGMLHCVNDDIIVMYCLPKIQNFIDLKQKKMFISDLSSHDGTRNYIIKHNNQRNTMNHLIEKQHKQCLKKIQQVKNIYIDIDNVNELIHELFPSEIAIQYCNGENISGYCQQIDVASVLFTKINGFYEISLKLEVIELIKFLNNLFEIIDKITDSYNVYKVETVSDSYMVVCGAPTQNDEHADIICDFALEVYDVSKNIKNPINTSENIQMCIGINCGSIVTGIIGNKIFRYCLFGDTVNTASRMTTNCEPEKIQLTQNVIKNLTQPYNYIFDDGREIEIKGKGNMKTFYLMQHSDVGRDKAVNRCTSFINKRIDLKKEKKIYGKTKQVVRTAFNVNKFVENSLRLENDNVDQGDVINSKSITHIRHNHSAMEIVSETHNVEPNCAKRNNILIPTIMKNDIIRNGETQYTETNFIVGNSSQLNPTEPSKAPLPKNETVSNENNNDFTENDKIENVVKKDLTEDEGLTNEIQNYSNENETVTNVVKSELTRNPTITIEDLSNETNNVLTENQQDLKECYQATLHSKDCNYVKSNNMRNEKRFSKNLKSMECEYEDLSENAYINEKSNTFCNYDLLLPS